MEVSPFPFHGPLAPDQVVGREPMLRQLVEQVTSRRPTVLVAPRRFGKTSLLRRLGAELAPTTTMIFVDLYELRSWADFAARVDDGLAGVTTKHRPAIDQIAAGLELNLGVVKASLSGRRRQDPGLTADRLLDVIVTTASRTPTVLVMDEFSSIARLDGAAGLLRTKLQHHFDQLGLVFAGSEPSTMQMLFASSDQPFYAQADLISLPGLTSEVVQQIVLDGFGGHPPTGLAARIMRLSAGHPQRTMQLADAAWRFRAGLGEPDQVWEAALAEVRRATADGFEVRFAALSTADQAVLRLVAGGAPLHGNAAAALSLSSSSADRSRRSLIGNGQIGEDDGLHVIDPLFGDWLRHRFPL